VERNVEYEAYIGSSAWDRRRTRRLEKDGRKCQGCGSTAAGLHVHHRTYERFGDELLNDLVTVCEDCHAFVHEEKDRTGLPLDAATDTTLAALQAEGVPGQAARAAAAMRKDKRDERLTGGIWLKVDCDDRWRKGKRLLGCGVLAGEACVITEEDITSGEWDEKRYIIGGYRPKMHPARWIAHLESLTPEERQRRAKAKAARAVRKFRRPRK
jgi:hypothetical protein